MKALFVGDIQTYHKPDAYGTSKNILDVTLEAIEELYSYAIANSVDTIYHLGDLFEYSTPQEITRVRLINFFNTYRNSGIKFKTISGNHDIHRRMSYGKTYPVSVLNTLEAACPLFEIIDINKLETLSGFEIEGNHCLYGVPYFSVEADFKKALNDISLHIDENGVKYPILLMHQDLVDEIPGSQIDPFDPMFSKFHLILGGHLHNRRKIKHNFYLLGSLLQQKGNDISEISKGMYLYDFDKPEDLLKFIPLSDKYPKFVYYYKGQEIDKEDEGNYIIYRQTAKQKKEAKENIPDFGEVVDDTDVSGRGKLIKSFIEAKGFGPNYTNLLLKDVKAVEATVFGSKKFLEYKSVTVEGYKSYANPKTITLNTDNLTLYLGENGAGKSTPFRAIYWAESGRSYVSDVSKEDIITEEWMQKLADNWKGTRVIVEVQVGVELYQVCRHIAYKGLTHGVKGNDSFMVFRYDHDKWVHINLSDEVPVAHQESLPSKDGKLRDTKLWEILKGISHKLFLNSIMFDSNTVRSILSSSSDKSDLLQNLLDVSWTEDLTVINTQKYQKAKETLNESVQELHKVEIELITKDTRLTSELSRLSDIKNQVEARKKPLKEEIRKYEIDLRDKEKVIKDIEDEGKAIYAHYQECQAKHTNAVQSTDSKYGGLIDEAKVSEPKLHSELLELKNSLYKVDDEISDLSNKRYLAQRKLEDVEEELKRLKDKSISVPDEVCVTCNRPLPKDKAIALIKSRISEKKEEKNNLEDSLDACSTMVENKKIEKDSLTQLIEGIKDQIDSIKAKIREIEADKQSELASIKQEYSEADKSKVDYQYRFDISSREFDILSGKLNSLREELNKLEDYKEDDSLVVSLTEEIGKVSETKRILEKQKAKLEIEVELRGSISRKVLNAKGLKAFAINNQLQRLTEYANKYASVLGTDIVFYLDSRFNYMAKMEIEGQYRNVHKLSDGQLTSANLIWVFSLNDLIRESVDCSFLFLDEPYTNLDPENSSKITDLIVEKAKDTSLHLITHSQRINATNVNMVEVMGGKNQPTYIKTPN